MYGHPMHTDHIAQVLSGPAGWWILAVLVVLAIVELVEWWNKRKEGE